MYGRSWLEIDLEKIKENAEQYSKLLYAGQEIIAVVKANAYGLGAVRVATALCEAGVRHFAVASLNEAIELREAGVLGSILILSYTPPELLQKVKKYSVMQTVYSEEYADALIKSGTNPEVQIAIETGMSRIGLSAKQPGVCIKTIRTLASRMRVRGVFTHLAAADDKEYDEFTKMQILLFREVCDGISDLRLDFIHSLNSAGGVWHNDKDHKYVRVGIMLYGLSPAYGRALPIRLYTPVKWKSRVSMVKEIDEGDYVGYGLTFRAKRPTRVATIATGYADGYPRALSGAGRTFINGRPAKIIGRVCMDQFMIDATDFPALALGNSVTLLGECYTADEMAGDIGRIGYEIICGISNRVERVYCNF